MTQTITIKTHRRNELIDITRHVAELVSGNTVADGSVMVFVPHTTAGVTINENADPDVVHDILLTLEQLVPRQRQGYRHAEGNSDAHVKAGMVGSSVTVMIEDSKLCLGTWQSIYFCEFDGPRSRKVLIRIGR